MHYSASVDEMTTSQGGDVVLENVHFRHCPKWSVQLQLSEGAELLFCVACMVEMMEAEDISVSITLFFPLNLQGYDHEQYCSSERID